MFDTISNLNSLHLENVSTSSISMAIFFSTIFFTTASLAIISWRNGDYGPFEAAMNPRSSPLDLTSFSSIFTMLYHWSVFGMILFFAYICENHPQHLHGEKHYDRDEFFFLTALIFVASAYTVSKNDKSKQKKKDNSDKSKSSILAIEPVKKIKNREVASVKPANDVLNRDQTEEWKGWMQYMFLLYHYYHAEEVYNSIRIMITCYVWMTGFGNFSFFYLKGDYSMIRVVQMLWRLNFLVVFLCLTQGSTYILYYICPLHTFFFLMVYVTMSIGKQWNYSKYGLRIKLGLVALFIFFVWDVDTGLFAALHFFLKETPQLGATGGAMWEWYFRTTLDHWSTFLGMVFAANYPITSLFIRKLEAQPPFIHFVAKATMGAGLICAFYFWVTGPFMSPKLEYNATNSYYGFVPLIVYIYFRNLTPTLRSYSLELLHQIGKSTLETYLMQHHIWLTSNAKSLLIIIPGWHKLNMLLVTMIYFYTSRRLYRLTLFLRGMHLPDDFKKCMQSIITITLLLAANYCAAWLLTYSGQRSLTSIAIVSIISGLILYSIILKTTWTTKNLSFDPAMKEESMRSMKLTSPSAGALFILLLGLLWNGLAANGKGKIVSLPATCEKYVNDGIWVPLDPCNEDQRGTAYRNSHVENIVCPDPANKNGNSYAWGWHAAPSSTQCRFVSRTGKQLKKQLASRTITFAGDSTSRYLYFGLLYSADIADNDISFELDSDLSHVVDDSLTVEFKWAPFVDDQVKVVKSYNAMGNSDILIIGGGLWDKLHHRNTTDAKEEQIRRTSELATEIASAVTNNHPVVWMTPTSIYDINTTVIAESQVEEIRQSYSDLGVLKSSSFVLDGPTYTRDRVSESHYGVYYPAQVYNAGVQILLNAFDWLLDSNDVEAKEFIPNKPGKMAHAGLGLMMLMIVMVGLFLFDGFLGFSYLAAFYVCNAAPIALYEEAFIELHEKNGLPEIAVKGNQAEDCEMEKLMEASI